MKKSFIAVMLILSIPSFSQVEKGDKELSFSGNLNTPTEGGGGNGTLSISFTQYLTGNFSLGTSVIMAFYTGPKDYLDPDAGNEIKMTPFIGLFATYNFLTSNGKLLPYIGGEYTFSWVETIEFIGLGTPLVTYEGLHFAGGKAGLKIFMTENVNFDVNLKYQTLLSGPEGYEAGNIGVNFGVGIILPSKN